MLRKSFSFVVAGTMLFLLAVFMVAGASKVDAESRTGGQIQYWVTIDGNLSGVHAQQGDFKVGPAALFERSPATGQWQRLEQSGRENSDASALRTFGYAVAIDGEYAIVGAEWQDGFKGAAYIFKRKGDGWAEVQKLSPPDLERFDHFGSSVSISGDYAVVGATWQNLFRGAVYVFKREGREWVQQDKLTAGDAKPDDRFGCMVRIDGTDITIGAGSADLQDAATSLAYRFQRTGDAWAEGQKVALPAMEKSGADTGELLIESGTSRDVFVLAETIGRDTETPPLLAPMAPPPPSTVVATDGAFEDRVEILWSSVDMDAIIYRIERNGTLISVASSDDSLYADETGVPGITYNYCVIVVDMAGEQSVPACDSGSRIVFPPANLWASDGHFDRFVRLVWTDMSFVEAGYLIKRNGAEIGTTAANTAVFDDTTAETEITYNYQVIAFDADGNRATPVADSGFRGIILPPLEVSASDGEYPDYVKITWTDQAKNEKGYNVYRDGSLIRSTGAGTNAMSCRDSTAVNGQSYDYCVTTRDSSSSESIPVCDEGGRGILPAPEDVSATDSTFDDRVEITWDDPSDLEDGFEILRDGTVIDSTVANVTYYKDVSAVPGISHAYCVVAFSKKGGRSAEECDVGFQSIVLAPFDVKAADGECEDRVDVTWKSTSTTAVLFKAFRDTTFIKSVSVATQSYSDYGGTAGQKYAYSVVAVTALEDEAESEPDTGRRELRAPTEVAASDQEYEDKIVISWADNSRLENGYLLSRQDTSAAVDSVWLGPNRTSYTDWTAVPGVTHRYSVAAFDSLGEALGFSAPATDSGRRVLLPPTNVRATDGEFEKRVEITWDDNSAAEDGYRIYRGGSLIGETEDNFTSFTDFWPRLHQESEYAVVAFDAYGESEADSDYGSTTLLPPLSVNASETYLDEVVLTWVDQSQMESGYEILRDEVPIATVGSNVTSFTDFASGPDSPFEYCARSVRSFSSESGVTYAGGCSTPGPAYAVAVAGDYAYVADYDIGGLQVIDITDPTAPHSVGGCHTPGKARGVAISGNYAFVAAETNGLQVIDISDPTNPVMVAAHLIGEAQGIAIGGNYAYVAAGPLGLLIFDVSDPIHPDLVGSHPAFGGVNGVAVSGPYAYIAEMDNGLVVLDISDPTAPTLVSYYGFLPSPARGVTLSGTYAYVADGNGGLQVFDISSWAVIVGSCETPGLALCVTVAGGYAYVADDESGIQVIDISDPAYPVSVGSYDTPGRAQFVVTRDDYAYVADHSAGLQVLEIGAASTADPIFVGACDTPWKPHGVAVAGDYAYVADWDTVQGDYHLWAIDASDPSNPFAVGSCSFSNRVFDLAIRGDYAYVANYPDGLKVISISDPTNPTLVGGYNTPGLAYEVALRGDYAYVADWTSGLQVIDISDPENPALAGDCDTPGRAEAVALSGDYAFIADNVSGLQVIDISDPFNPVIAGSYATPDTVRGLAIAGDYAYLAVADSGLLVLNISEPTSPQFTAVCNVPGRARDVTTFGDYAYVADEQHGVLAIDISSPVNPVPVGSYEAPGWVRTVTLSGDYAYVANYGARQLEILKIGTSSAQDCDQGGLYRPEVEDEFSVLVGSVDQKLLAGDPNAWDHFGNSVAVSGDVAIIGAYHDDYGDADAGAAYIFERGSGGVWSQTQKLLAGDPNSGDYFGYSVAVSGDVAIIAAVGDDQGGSGAGAAYIFERATDGTWIQKQKLLTGDPNSGDAFGYSVAVGDDVAVIGACSDDQGGANAGAAYIFERGSGGVWSQTQKLLAGDPNSADLFGYSVAVSGDVAIIAASYDDQGGANAGAAYIFERGSGGVWSQTQKLLAGDPNSSDLFGNSVAVSGDVAIIGAYGDGEADDRAGAAYIFERAADGTWPETETQKLMADDPAIEDRFGYSVAISGHVAIIGAIGDTDFMDAGKAYIFQRAANGTWSQSQKLLAGDPNPGDQYGYSVAVSGDVTIVGAEGDDQGGTDAGAAYIGGPLVAASDGTLNSRVRITWNDCYSGEDGFYVYRDGELIETSGPDVEVYEDFEAQPGRTYEYCVAAYKGGGTVPRSCDFGWRPPNGNITGRVSTAAGAGVEAISVGLNPEPTRALLLDGSGGHVYVPDDESELYFNASQDFTVEMWIKYTDHSLVNRSIIAMLKGSRTRFDICTRGGVTSPEPGQLYIQILGTGVKRIWTSTTVTGLNDGQWHHIAVVRDADDDPLSVYVDGANATGSVVTVEPIDELSGTCELFLGGFGDFPVRTWFVGQMDEVRIWNVARSEAEIKATMDRLLTGKEENLVGYWPLDEDGSSAVTDFSGENHYGSLHGGVYWTEDAAPIDVSAPTDLQGNYVLDHIRYGQETTFEVWPRGSGRQFSPAFKTITLSTGHPVENQVNFIETTSFTVSGVVKFAGTDCSAPNVEIHVDGQRLTQTDKNGEFAVAVGNGDHWLKPWLEGRTFDPDSLLLPVDGDTSGISFTDTTTRTLSGIVGGGCRYPIGLVTIEIRSENSCMDTSYLRDTYIFTDYEIELPPQKYLVRASVDPDSIPPGLDVIDMMKFFDNLGDRLVDLTHSDTTLDFVYRAPLEVTIEGLEEYITDCDPLTFQGRTLPDSLPVIPQGTSVNLLINVNENYGQGNLCPLDSGTVIIYDEIFDQQDTPQELVVKNGVANYKTFASTPSLVAGRLDADGDDRSFQKAIRARVVVEGRTPVTATEWALVTGHVAPQGADFVTAACTEFLTYILRDPPGDNSYAYIEKGNSLRTNIEYDKFTLTDQAGVKFSAKFGIKLGTWVGIGAGTWTETESKWGFETEILAGHMMNRESGTDVTITTKEQFSTSPDELLVGEGGDVYVGTGFNFIFAEVGVIDVKDCEVVRSTSVGFEPDSIATTYAYTHQYIQNVLIPEYNSKVVYYNTLGHPDSAAMFEARLNNWRDMLARNDLLKQEAKFKINRSFSAGADFSYSHQTDTTWFDSETHGFVGDFSAQLGQWTFGSVTTNFGLSIPVRVHTEYVPQKTETETKRSLTVGYVLSDDDIGDHFTVDVKEDSIYPSPVFDVRAGVSSCPYEPWPNPKPGPDSGKARMMPRDKPVLMTGGDPVLDGVPADEPAAFTLNLSNLSPTEEIRECVLREITTSNHGGAIIKANGAPLANGVSYFIDGNPLNNSNEVTLTIERGPTKYRYADLALILYPPCEYSIWEQGGPLQIADTLALSVNFKAPCSDITLYRPEPGWRFNKAQQDSGKWLNLVLTDYELEVSELDSVKSVWGQYRRLGVGQQGPSAWVNIPADSLGATGTIIRWFPPVALSDGAYELRAYTKCQEGGQGYSNVSVGTIDRSAPQVLGTPEPSDQELSLGEEISITFNEPIDCGSINTNGLLRYFDGPSAGDTIEVDWVCDGTTIVFTPASGVDPDDLEGQLLEARVAGVRDLAGNPMEAEKTWTFRVWQSVFTWYRKSIAADVAFGAPGTITADLVNGSDLTVDFVITTVPWWITDIFDTTGTIAPGGTQSISFAIQEDLPIRRYKGSIVADTSDGKAILKAMLVVNLTVSCHEPVWEMDPGRYENTMTVVAEVEINGTMSSDPNDRVAAFVGNQLRGVANVDSATGLVYLTVASNRTWGENVRFQVWDDDECKLYNSTLERFPFVSDTMIGSPPDDPVILHAQNVPPDTWQTIPLAKGWSWFSTNVQAVDMSPNGVLADLALSEGDLIKSDIDFAEFDPDMGWVGTLSLLDNVHSYMIRLSEEGTILQEGSVVDPDTTPIPVNDGWNWIGYLPTEPMAVGTALQNLTSVSDGDMVKTQTAFAQRAGSVWSGSLDSMEAGMGYKLYLQTAPAPGHFYYPGGGPTAPTWAANTEQQSNRAAETTKSVPGWSVNQNAYQYNMTVIAALNIEGNQCRSDEVVIGAFVDGECRGVARPRYLSLANPYVAFLMIHSSSVAGQRVEFQAFVPEERAVYNVAETISYQADGAVGSIRKPLILSAKGIAFEVTENVPATFSLSQNYPNPFNPVTTIEYSLPEQLQVALEVFNVLGQRVKTLVNVVQPAGRHKIVWDGKDAQGKDVASGIYFYRLEAGEFAESKRMVILK